MVKAGGDLLKIWVRMRVYWSAQAFRQEGERPSGPGAFLGPVYTFLGEKRKTLRPVWPSFCTRTPENRMIRKQA